MIAVRLGLTAMVCTWMVWAEPAQRLPKLGREVAIRRHLADDEEFRQPLPLLIRYGRKLFEANWTDQEGAGRPLAKGTGKALIDPSEPLTGMRGMNRISGPDANSCAGCHHSPYGLAGGGGDFVTNVFVLGQRFDFISFDPGDRLPTKGAMDEGQRPVTLNTIANQRATTGLFGAGFIEMLAREMTEDLQAIRDTIAPGHSRELISKGVSFGHLARRADGMWDVSRVQGLPQTSIVAPTPVDVPNLVIRPWHQAGNVVSLREFANTAYNQHHGMQSTERFGLDTDPDGDGFLNELTRADVTAVAVFQAVLPVPGRVIPNDTDIEKAVLQGEDRFVAIGCAACHVPRLPLNRRNWVFTEPNPFNLSTNLRIGDAPTLRVNLVDAALPKPRLTVPANTDTLEIPAYTDLKLHDITDPADKAAAESLDMNQPTLSAAFRQGNRRFLTKRLWGCANEPPFFHHGLFTTLRQAILAHSGEATPSRRSFERLSDDERNAVIEFLKTLQVLPPGTEALIVDENFKPRKWPPLTQ